jgi:hypothetical protein
MGKDEISEILKRDKDCKRILIDLVSHFNIGKSKFNKPGYMRYAIGRLFSDGSKKDYELIFNSSFEFYKKHGLVEMSESEIDIKEKVLDYI